jgi:hypothetical protein
MATRTTTFNESFMPKSKLFNKTVFKKDLIILVYFFRIDLGPEDGLGHYICFFLGLT